MYCLLHTSKTKEPLATKQVTQVSHKVSATLLKPDYQAGKLTCNVAGKKHLVERHIISLTLTRCFLSNMHDVSLMLS